MRFEGPVAEQNQRLFLQDWATHVDGDGALEQLALAEAPRPPAGDVVAQAIGTGPTVRNSESRSCSKPSCTPRRRSWSSRPRISCPRNTRSGLLAAAGYRGVRTSLVLPARNDSWIVGAASRSYYLELLHSGVRIFEYVGGLLHTKSLTLDGEVALIGSANLDRRSFELNYENNILLRSSPVTAELRARQQDYIAGSREITLAEVEAWGIGKQLWNNSIAMLGPIL
jgi:Phosphatidylserine/phosphatidylglycerophosphate/cardiolipin synthases and related enzymes